MNMAARCRGHGTGRNGVIETPTLSPQETNLELYFSNTTNSLLHVNAFFLAHSLEDGDLEQVDVPKLVLVPKQSQTSRTDECTYSPPVQSFGRCRGLEQWTGVQHRTHHPGSQPPIWELPRTMSWSQCHHPLKRTLDEVLC